MDIAYGYELYGTINFIRHFEVIMYDYKNHTKEEGIVLYVTNFTMMGPIY